MSEHPSGARTSWWGEFELDEDTGGRWEVGPSTIWLYRTNCEWRVVQRVHTDPRSTDPLADRSRATVPVEASEMAEALEGEAPDYRRSRYGRQRTGNTIQLDPTLADRPVVSRPEDPLNVLPGETVTLYVSTPLWMRIRLPDADCILEEIPSHRLSDTWLGPSTVEGELCYATRTSGRLRLDNVSFRLHRAVTPIEVHNRADDSLLLERVQLPTPHLSIYRDPPDAFWTEAVEMTRSPGSQGAEVHIRPGPPPAADEAELLQEPRDAPERGLFTSSFRAFGAFFSSQ